ncbi:hypothetical protein LAZ67_1003894 [Cordylochernes scorpioides]|uniref:Transposase n=1 Tax=Cordylochernes scorpioides TaxID=51811 RepID=A0ABY6K0R8_9ARAC|nr:hypothetical protein LAZ67_1003894 [Cordylochernes scorpioides]
MLTKGVRFHHDNARPYTAHQTTALIEEFEWELVSHPPYSPDVAPSDFHFFPELKKNLGGTQFQDDDELEEAVLGFLRGQAAEFFDSGFHKWAWKKCNRNIPDAAKSLQGRLHFKITVWEVAQVFKEGREEVADEPRSGRQTTARTDENVDRVLEVLRTDRRLSIQQIADTLHMSTFVVHGIVTEDLQMQLRVLRCQELLDLIQNEPGFLNSVVTGDEFWMFEYDPESKRQSCAWHTKSSPRPKKARMSKSRIKTMSIVFFDIRGIVHCEFVPQGQTVNSAFYLEVLRRLKRRIARVRTDIKDTVKLHHDNATSHTAFIITNFLARSNTPVIPHPPYSPDLAPCDFFLFPRLKREMKGKHWETVESIQHHDVTTFLRSIPVEEFQGAFHAWQTRLRKCIDAGGMYFEEN